MDGEVEVAHSLERQQVEVKGASISKGVECQCLHCSHEFTASTASRLVEHLLGREHNVKTCTGKTAAFKAIKEGLGDRVDAALAVAATKQRVQAAKTATTKDEPKEDEDGEGGQVVEEEQVEEYHRAYQSVCFNVTAGAIEPFGFVRVLVY